MLILSVSQFSCNPSFLPYPPSHPSSSYPPSSLPSSSYHPSSSFLLPSYPPSSYPLPPTFLPILPPTLLPSLLPSFLLPSFPSFLLLLPSFLLLPLSDSSSLPSLPPVPLAHCEGEHQVRFNMITCAFIVTVIFLHLSHSALPPPTSLPDRTQWVVHWRSSGGAAGRMFCLLGFRHHLPQTYSGEGMHV